MITTKIVLLGDTHPARLRGYGYSVQIFASCAGLWQMLKATPSNFKFCVSPL